MKVIQQNSELQEFLEENRQKGSIGFVPTMGALHLGHLSLLKKSLEKDMFTICSIFVNPTQFNESSDYDSYPQVLDADLELLKSLNIDVVFAPPVAEIYPNGLGDMPHYEIGNLENILEGEHRPGHFQGVCHIIELFLQKIKPDHIYMGEKDWQQIAVVQFLIEMNAHKTKLVPCPTLREKSGLAMSSRNMNLSKDGKVKAAAFHKALCHIRDNQKEQSFEILKKEAEALLIKNDFEPEYIALCDAKTLAELEDFNPKKNMRLIAAAFIEGVRLIDNIAV